MRVYFVILSKNFFMQRLTFTTCQAPIAEFTVAEVSAYLGEQLGIETRFINGIEWPERQRRLIHNEIDVGWMCGAPYVRAVDTWAVDAQNASIELLAAPVMAEPRYSTRPIYFSDVVVRRDSPYQTFADLRGARWVYNEPGSHSGVAIVSWYLAQHGLDYSFFGEVRASGAHQYSLRMVLDGDAAASAIDATVLDLLVAQQPQLREKIRVIEALGPSPIPPWVIGRHVPPALRNQLRLALTEMHADMAGQAILQRSQVRQFAPVTDANYERTREMLTGAKMVVLPT